MRRVFAEVPESDASTALRLRKSGPPSVPAEFLVMVGALASLGRSLYPAPAQAADEQALNTNFTPK